jgi:RNA:NAD 2'-phosphotransferase (TPT1/KptA family)
MAHKPKEEQKLPPQKIRQINSLVKDIEGKRFATTEEAIEAALGFSKSVKNELNRPPEEDN